MVEEIRSEKQGNNIMRQPEDFLSGGLVAEFVTAAENTPESARTGSKAEDLAEETIESDLRFIGRIFTVETSRVRLVDGRQSMREIVHHPGGAAVLAVNENNNVYLVRQYRAGATQILREIPAGKLEIGEEPISCARRELLEETGLVADEWTLLTKFYPTPAYCDEIISLYLARGLTGEKQQLSEGEILQVEEVPLAEVLNQIKSGIIQDGKTAIAVMLFADLLKQGEF